MKPPGPGPLGSAIALVTIARAGLPGYLQRLSRRYGPVSGFRLGLAAAVFVDDAALVERILVTQQHLFTRDFGAAIARDLLGEGLLTTEDPLHLERRRLMQPAFRRTRSAAYADTFVREAQRITGLWPGLLALDIGAEMTKLTLGVVGETLFGADVRGSAAAVAAILGRFTRGGGAFAALLLVLAPLLGAARGRARNASMFFARERAELGRIVAPLIERRRAAGGDGDDLLSLLLAARDEGGAGLDDAALLSEVVTLVLAGHETTSNALTWTWLMLALHPPVERRLHAEIDDVLAGRSATLADLARLPYAASVFAEALRLYPPAPAFARRPQQPIELGGYAIAAGTSVYVSPYVTQRNARYFDDPETFAPERWQTARPPKYAYFPFGGGSKRCIGESFAELEGILVLVTIAQRYSLRAAEKLRAVPALHGLTRPDRSVLLRPVARRLAAPSLAAESRAAAESQALRT